MEFLDSDENHLNQEGHLGKQGGGGQGFTGGHLLYSPHVEVHLGLGPTLHALVIKDQVKHHRERGEEGVLPIQFTNLKADS